MYRACILDFIRQSQHRVVLIINQNNIHCTLEQCITKHTTKIKRLA